MAIANTFLSNADEDRPDGSVRWEFTGDTIDTNTYDGSGNITGTRPVPKFKKVVTLSPEGVLQYDQQQQIAIAMNTWALAQTGILTAQQLSPVTLDDLTPRLPAPAAAALDDSGVTPEPLVRTVGAADLSAHVATTRDAIDARIQWQIDVDRAARIAALAAQGLVPGMTAYDRDMETFDRQSTDARIQAWLAAQQEQTRIVQMEGLKGTFANDATHLTFTMASASVDQRNQRRLAKYQALRDAAEFVAVMRQQELQERLTVRAASINEISSLMHGGQVQIPQFQGFNPGRIDRTPVMEAVYQSAAMDMQKWQVKVQQQQSMFGGLLGFAGNMMGGMMALSDRRLKTDIERIGDDPRGFGWYLWRYLWDGPDTRRVGVMAQEVPWAAVELPGGWLAVDYARVLRG